MSGNNIYNHFFVLNSHINKCFISRHNMEIKQNFLVVIALIIVVCGIFIVSGGFVE